MVAFWSAVRSCSVVSNFEFWFSRSLRTLVITTQPYKSPHQTRLLPPILYSYHSQSSYNNLRRLSSTLLIQFNSQAKTMEETIKEQSSAAVSGNSASARSKLQRYGLRSITKTKEQKPDATDRSNSSESNAKRGRITPSVSKSVGVLDFSGKDKSSSAKPPRRLSIPTKSFATPSTKLVGNITPISETRKRRSPNGQGPQSRTQTPSYDISRTSSRVKFNLLTSASYWLNQIKLSESAAKHLVSLGFFKLALEAGCEPCQRMQDELRAYVRRHQLAELGEPVKELFQSYNIAENQEQSQSQVSETISHVPEEGTPSSDDEVHLSSSSTVVTGKPKPKCLNTETESTQPTPTAATDPTKKETSQKGTPGSKLRENLRLYSANSKPAVNSGNRRSVQKSEKPSKLDTNKEKREIKKQGKKSDVKVKEVPTLAEDNSSGNKENMDVQTNDEIISLTEVV